MNSNTAIKLKINKHCNNSKSNNNSKPD